ncbi:acyl-CoA dehydrogenase family protein [Streptococcus rifensis]
MFKQDVLDKVSQFSAEQLADKAADFDKAEEFPDQLLLQFIAETNVFNLLVSEEPEVGLRTFLEAIRLVSQEFASLASIILTQGIYVLWTLNQFGTQIQKERYLDQLVSGKILGSFAFSEQDVRLKKSMPQTLARQVEGGWILDGQKHMVSNASVAGLFLVFAQTVPEKGSKGTAIFIVDAASPGVTIGPAIAKSGMKALPLASVSFEGVEIPEEAFLGDGYHEGLSYLSQILVKMRLAISAQALGVAEGVFQKGLALSVLKRGFGGRLMDVSVNQFKFSDMEVQLAACEAFYHDYIQSDMSDQRRVAMLKLLSTATAQNIADEVVRVIGTYSFMDDNDLERYVNDAKVTGLYGGSTDSLKKSVAQAWL